MTNEELVKQIQAGTDPRGNLERLYLANIGLIRKISGKYCGGDPDELEDLTQEAYFGLVRAVELYDPAQGVTFAAYAANWIKQSIVRYLEDCGTVIRLPVYLRERIARYKRIVNDFRVSFGRDPTGRELAAALDITEEAAATIAQDAQALRPRSLSELIADDEDLTLQDVIPDPINRIEEAEDWIRNEELQALLRKLIDDLDQAEGQILRERYIYGRTYRECGEALGISASKARDTEQKALQRLRTPKICRQIRPYADEILTANAYKGTSYASFRHTRTSSEERYLLMLEARNEGQT